MGMQRIAGRDAVVVKGTSLLCEAVAPRLNARERNILGNAGHFSWCVPITNLPMHPALFNCNRLMSIFSSYIRWKLLKISVEFIPVQGTNVNGTILMGFTSCIADGGVDGAMNELKAAISDLPGVVEVPLGQITSGRAVMPFTGAFDWNYTCRRGGTLNEVYCGAFVSAFNVSPAQYTPGSHQYLGDFRVHYEIALAEPSAVLNFIRPTLKGAEWVNTAVTAGTAIEASFPTGTTNQGDILQLTWSDPSETNTSTKLVSELASFAGLFGVQAGKGPKLGQTVYAKNNGVYNSSALDKERYRFYEHYEDAVANRGELMFHSTNTDVPSTQWLSNLWEGAKVIIPAVSQVVAML